MVPLAVWSKNVPHTDHCARADRLLAVKPAADLKSLQDRYDSGFGKLEFPDSITSRPVTLADLVESDSLYTLTYCTVRFSILGGNHKHCIAQCNHWQWWKRCEAELRSSAIIEEHGALSSCAASPWIRLTLTVQSTQMQANFRVTISWCANDWFDWQWL